MLFWSDGASAQVSNADVLELPRHRIGAWEKTNRQQHNVPLLASEQNQSQIWFSWYKEEYGISPLGEGQKGVSTVAIKIPKGKVGGNDATVDGFRFAFNGQHFDDIKVWISTTLPEGGADDADLEVVSIPSSEVSTGVAHMNEVIFSQHYEIPEDGIYVGYEYNITADIPDPSSIETDEEYEAWFDEYYYDAYPMFIKYGPEVTTGAFLYRSLSSEYTWIDYADYQVPYYLFADALITGVFEQNAATPSDFGHGYALVGSSAYMIMNVTNKGAAGLSNFDYVVTSSDGKEYEGHMDLETPLSKVGSKCEVQFELPADDQTGISPKSLVITKVNGEPNEAEAIEAHGVLYTIAESAQMRPFFEEFTGAWCGWCVRGNKAMQMLENDYGDKLTLVAVHADDPMDLPEYDFHRDISNGYPSMLINRTVSVDPYYGLTENTPYGISELVPYAINDISVGSITAKVDWADDEMTKIYVETETTFQYDEPEPSFAIAYILVADGLKGEGEEWWQNNFYSGDDELSDQYMQEYVDMPDPITDFIFNHVAIAGYGLQYGLEGSLEGEVKCKQPMTSSFVMDITNNQLVQDKKRLSVITLLVDKTTGTVVNSDIAAVSGNVVGITTVSCSTREQTIYNMAGQRIINNNGLRLVRGKDGTVRKVMY